MIFRLYLNEVMQKLDKDILDTIQFIIDNGPKKDEFEVLSKGLPVYFTGRLMYSDMVWILCECNITMNIITKGAVKSIINKHMDYAMAGLPVLNTQESKEYRMIIEENYCEINRKCSDDDEVANAINELVTNRLKREQMGVNHRRVAEKFFNRKNTYR